MKKALLYLKARAADPQLSGNAAARVAGFANGRPSKFATTLYETWLALDDEDLDFSEEIRSLERRIARDKRKLAKLRIWESAQARRREMG